MEVVIFTPEEFRDWMVTRPHMTIQTEMPGRIMPLTLDRNNLLRALNDYMRYDPELQIMVDTYSALNGFVVIVG